MICLAPLGSVEPFVMLAMGYWVSDAFGFAAQPVQGLEEPEYAYDARRRQYSSIAILRALAELCPPDATRLLAITGKDLFIPTLTFIYGQAQLGGRLAIVSLARLRQEFYGLPGNPSLLELRAHKEVLHEMGHTFRLVHCPDKRCAMSLSTNIQQVDRKQDRFCKDCAMLLEERIAGDKA